MNTAQKLFLSLNLNTVLSDSIPEKIANIWQIKWNRIRSIKFETVRINFLSDVFGLLLSRNFASMATWRNDFSLLLASRDVISYRAEYGKKNWQVPKYRVKSRRNTDTAFMIGYIYAYPSRVLFYLEHVCTINQPQPWQENAKRYLEFIGTTITGARSLEDTLIPF